MKLHKKNKTPKGILWTLKLAIVNLVAQHLEKIRLVHIANNLKKQVC